eukprot:764421-Hanusia_phi.AAC.1
MEEEMRLKVSRFHQRVLGCQREAGLQGGVQVSPCLRPLTVSIVTQLAGGTNDYTATLLERNELFKSQARKPRATRSSRSSSSPLLFLFSPPLVSPPQSSHLPPAAFGGYARKLLRDELEALNVHLSLLRPNILDSLQAMGSSLKLEEHQQLAESASMR